MDKEAGPDLLPGQLPEMVGIEVVPIGREVDRCEGGIVRLVKNEGQVTELSLAAGLGAAQCREVARQLLTIADAASGGTERTIMCVSSVSMWKLQGQALIVRCNTQDGRVQFEFAVNPARERVVKPQRKLIIP